MDEKWCCEKLENLKIKENRLNTLTEIRVRLNETASLETNIATRLLSSPEIYECLEDLHDGGGGISREHFDIVSDILSICMANLSINQSDLPQLLERALTHRRPHIRALALNTILKELQRPVNSGEARPVVSDELLMHVLDALQQEETEVGVPAISILTLALETRLDKAPVKEALRRMLSGTDTVKCRVYELAVNLAKRSPGILQKVEFLLDRGLSELDNDDILLQVNILEILVPLAEQNHGLLYLERRQVFELMGKRVETLDNKPLDRLLVPSIMKFFGKIACVQPQKIILGYPHMIQCLFECFHSGDVSILPTAFDTLANLALSQQGKLLLDTHYANIMKETFQDYASYLRNLSSELKNRAFNTLEVIFTTVGQVTPQTSEILHKWFTYLADGSNMQFLMDFCRNPFPDIKVACLSFIRTICLYQWGIAALKDTAGFVEYLLDRKNEFDKEAKHAKFEVIQMLVDSPAFTVQTQLQMRTYINEGPYFVESAMDIAVEGN